MVTKLVEYALDSDVLAQVVRMPEGAIATRLVADGTGLKVQAFADPDIEDGVGYKIWLRLSTEPALREREEWSIGFADHDGVRFYGYAQPIETLVEEESFRPGYAHGAWSSSVAYEVGDQVERDGVLYVARESQAPQRPDLGGGTGAPFTPTTPGTDANVWAPVLAGGGAELAAELVVTDPLADQSVGETYAAGTPLETVLRDMLISYQLPSLANFNPSASSVIEHGTAYSWTTPVTFNSLNTENITLSSGEIEFRSGSVISSDTFTYASGTGTVAQSVPFTVPAGTFVVAAANAGQSGTATASQYWIEASGTNSNGGSFSRTDTINVYFRTYWGATSAQFTGSNGSTVVAALSGTTENDSKRTVTATSANANGSNYTYFAMPTCHFDAISSIVLNGAIPVYGAFTNKGTDTVNGVEYTFFESNAPGAFSSGDTLAVS